LYTRFPLIPFKPQWGCSKARGQRQTICWRNGNGNADASITNCPTKPEARFRLAGVFGDPIAENPTGVMQEAAFGIQVFRSIIIV
jgi:hypothetical protein